MRSDDGDWARVVYAYAADPEASIAADRFVEEVRAELRRHEPAGHCSPADLTRQAVDWAAVEGARFRALVDDDSGDLGRTGHRWVLVRRAVLDCAPLALVTGAWLQWLSAPGNVEIPVVLRILAQYASDVGAGDPGASRGSAFLELLRRLRLAENAVPTARLTGDQRIGERAFRLPALLMAMSRRPDDFRDELLGADLCVRTVGLLPALTMVRQALPSEADWDAIDPSRRRHAEGPTPAERSRAAVDELCAEHGDPTADAIGRGFAWTLGALRDWSAALHTDLVAAGNPAFEMAELIRLRSREGAVYHRQFPLAGTPLATWLANGRSNPGPLLDALAASPLVKPGRSQASPLVRGLVSERGPMFRVFSPHDLSVITRWIDSLPGPGSPADPAETTSTTVSGSVVQAPPSDHAATRLAGVAEALRAQPRSVGTAPAGPREAYWMLMRRTDTPVLRHWAQGYIAGWLARSRHGLDNRVMPLPPHWQRDGLRPWLQAQHDANGVEFEKTATLPLPDRAAVVDDAVQTAPLTLIDGSWLQGFADYEQASSEVGHSLFNTYWDELGNGEPRLNHPLIYREVLAEMGVELPPTASTEFARWPGFRDTSFELPVYWLCIGRYPRTFLPEVLGLNLAMELSGVGGTYRKARLALRAYGFNTRFVDIHNTIDNVATGHSAWAADAIDTLLATLPDAAGPTGRAAIWERVRVGYRSLNPPSGMRARLAARRATRSSARRINTQTHSRAQAWPRPWWRT